MRQKKKFFLEFAHFLPPTSNLQPQMVFLMSREADLKRQGWQKRFTTDEPRLSEAVEQYQEIGFEVLLEPIDTSSEDCTNCLALCDRYKTIYTRPKRE